MSASAQEFPELACYGLAGHSSSPRDLVDEVRHAERLGLGSVFLSERFNVKDAAVMAGVAAGVSERIGIATAATNHNTRHPLVTATLAMTAHRVSECRDRGTRSRQRVETPIHRVETPTHRERTHALREQDRRRDRRGPGHRRGLRPRTGG